jgi:hypothetical protein
MALPQTDCLGCKSLHIGLLHILAALEVLLLTTTLLLLLLLLLLRDGKPLDAGVSIYSC